MVKIDFFFQNPADFNESEGNYSSLFLLRRDILMSFGINPNDKSKIEFQVLLPGTMAIMAGIDLLSKFYLSDENGTNKKSGPRFVKFVEKYIDNTNAEVLYQLRNALLHSFGLYSKDKNGKEYNFILHQKTTSFILTQDNKNYYISIVKLLNMFENSIDKYRNDLSKDKILQSRFEEMFSKYGQIGILK